MTGAGETLSETTAQRLQGIAALDRLGAGMAIAARDLDLRGAGDLVGEEQAGHLRLIGLGLYQHLLGLAIREARGETVEDWAPEISIDRPGSLPVAYIPEAEMRLNLYVRLARISDLQEVVALGEELGDRFGPPPPEVEGPPEPRQAAGALPHHRGRAGRRRTQGDRVQSSAPRGGGRPHGPGLF